MGVMGEGNLMWVSWGEGIRCGCHGKGDVGVMGKGI